MNEKQLRAIHAHACAAVARAGQNLSPAEDRFWIAYIPAVLAAAKPVREFIPYTGETNYLAEDGRRYFVPATAHEPEPDAALPGAENDLVTEIAWLVDNGNYGPRTHAALRRAFATLATIEADTLRQSVEAMSAAEVEAKDDFAERDAIADALGLVRGSVNGRKVGYTWDYLVSAIKDVRDHAESKDEAATHDERAAFTSALILAICELPGRTSPVDEPSAMVANADEIASCVETALEKTGLCIATPQATVTLTRPVGEDPMADGQRSLEAGNKRLRAAYAVQQPAPIPDQMALVWRADVMRLMHDWIHKDTCFREGVVSRASASNVGGGA